MKGAGDKAFCAGGDIRGRHPALIRRRGLGLVLNWPANMRHAAIYDEGMAARQAGKSIAEDPSSLGYRFFFEEYELDYQIATHAKPQIALLNGITSALAIVLASWCSVAKAVPGVDRWQWAEASVYRCTISTRLLPTPRCSLCLRRPSASSAMWVDRIFSPDFGQCVTRLSISPSGIPLKVCVRTCHLAGI